MKNFTLAALAALSTAVVAQGTPPNCSECATAPMLRFSCSQLVVERLDPLVTPGLNPSPHLHQIVGGNTFNTTMAPENDIPAMSTCTSCTFSEDFRYVEFEFSLMVLRRLWSELG